MSLLLIGHRLSAIGHRPSAICHQPSSICHLPSASHINCFGTLAYPHTLPSGWRCFSSHAFRFGRIGTNHSRSHLANAVPQHVARQELVQNRCIVGPPRIAPGALGPSAQLSRRRSLLHRPRLTTRRPHCNRPPFPPSTFQLSTFPFLLFPFRRIIVRLYVMGGTNAQLPIGRQGPLPGYRPATAPSHRRTDNRAPGKGARI